MAYTREKRAFISYIKSVCQEIKGETVRMQPFISGRTLCHRYFFSRGTGTYREKTDPGIRDASVFWTFAEKQYAWYGLMINRDTCLQKTG